MVFETIGVSRAAKCPVCGSKESPSKPIEKKVIMELCGREGKRVFLIVPKKNLNIDTNKLSLVISSSRDFEIKVNANLGITFVDNAKNRTVSILKSGIMIVDNVNSEDEAYSFYRKIMVDGLKVNAGDIEP